MPSLVLNGSKISVRRESRNLIMERKKEHDEHAERICPHLADIDRVTIVGHPSLPISVLQVLMYNGIPVSFISERGRWYGTLHPDKNNNADRRIAQYNIISNTAIRLRFARIIVSMICLSL